MRPKIHLNNVRDGKANLVLRYTYKRNTRFSYGLSGIEINVKDWDTNKQQVRRSDKLYKLYNEQIEFLITACVEIRQAYNRNLDQLTKSVFKHELNKAQGIVKSEKVTFFKFYEEYIQKYENNTKNAYKNTLLRLNKFAVYYKKFDFKDIDLNWLYEFQDWCFLVKNFRPNTIQKSLAHVKKVLREAYENKLHQNDIFTHTKFNIKKAPTSGVYLSLDELAQIYRHKFDGKLEALRDLFILACFTGQRISDWSKLNQDNLSEEDGQLFFNILTQKTKKTVAIPLHPVTKIILEKYNNNLPKYSSGHINTSIKTICELAGIDSSVSKTEYRHGKPILVKYKKYELVTSHTARRSFATNMYLSGRNLEEIKHLTGHSNISTLELYIKASSLDHAKLIARSDFFKGKGFLKVV